MNETGRLSLGISSLLGFGVFRALSFSKLLPETGILRQLSLGILGGSGAVGFTLLQGSLHYLFTGDSTYLKEAVTWENLLFNLAFGAVMGPLAAKLFSKPGVNQVIKGPGKWLATILAKKTGKPIGAISSAISSAWQTVKATASISAISSLLIGGFDSFKQYKQNGEVDWKKTGQRTAMIFTTTLVFGVALGLGPKFMMKGCACDDPQVAQVQQSEKSVTEKSVTKGKVKIDYDLAKDYIRDVESKTGLKLHKSQIEKLKYALRENKYEKMTPLDTLKHRNKFNSVKNKLINEWEENTGQTWPRYTEEIYDKKGRLARDIGQLYDAHHIIENNFGGSHEWWNIHPAKFPDEHQAGIHGKGAPSNKLFPRR